MASATRTVKATCLCGSARHEITLPASHFPLQAHLCHCHSCRHLTGSLCLTIAGLEKPYEPSQELLDKLVAFNFSKRLIVYHCRNCGTQMIWKCYLDGDMQSKGWSWDVTTGTLEQADGVFEIQDHGYVTDTLDGGFSDFLTHIDGKQLERWPQGRSKGEQLPLFWRSPDAPKIEPKQSDKLYCHCKCGGVEFWISRPSERSKKALGSYPHLLIPRPIDQRKPDGSAWWLKDDGRKFLAGICACNSCRLDTGMEWHEWAFIPTIDIFLDKEEKMPFSTDVGTMKHYSSSEEVLRHFCATCGATMIYTHDERVELVDVAVGVIDAPEGSRAESWLDWETWRVDYREDTIPRAERFTLAVEQGLKQFEERFKPQA